eukprot:CAMPEP_0201595444 /NCGR_PEP_ID=MMETSP0190_2-20130828/192448_1 /ASSEMBLY_ACC=CAM_ASM_000263 /TAXON_ID=37353 /ORGANISM="Rosalina sp." /LENGTH=269 /DNA_ID=CAMNT_0048055439 /DNA_START=166 /DNA_END=972 /DNA_ORIENTATION=-
MTAVIQCSGYHACFNATFNGANTNGLSITEATGNESVLEQSQIICPRNGGCFIQVYSKYGMAHSIIDASQSISGDLSITTFEDWALNDTTVYCPILGSCSIYCGTGWGACANMNIQGQTTTGLVYVTVRGGEATLNSRIICPAVPSTNGDKNCKIHGTGDYGSEFKNLKGQTTTELVYVTVRGGDATLNSRIICPAVPSTNGDKNCKIHGTGDYGSEFKNLNIYATNGLPDVDLILDYNEVKEDNNPVMNCGFGYGQSCDLVYISSNSW